MTEHDEIGQDGRKFRGQSAHVNPFKSMFSSDEPVKEKVEEKVELVEYEEVEEVVVSQPAANTNRLDSVFVANIAKVTKPQLDAKDVVEQQPPKTNLEVHKPIHRPKQTVAPMPNTGKIIDFGLKPKKKKLSLELPADDGGQGTLEPALPSGLDNSLVLEALTPEQQQEPQLDHLPRENADGKPDAHQEANMEQAIESTAPTPERYEASVAATAIEPLLPTKRKHFPIIGWILAILLLFAVGVAIGVWIYLNQPEWLEWLKF